MTEPILTRVVNAYLQCGLWTTSMPCTEDEADQQWGHMEDHFDIDDCSNFGDVEAEISEFIIDNLDDLITIVTSHLADWEQIGHDFCLTRDRHGAGFWDRGYGPAGQRLTEAANVYGDSEFMPDNTGLKFFCEGSTR